MPDGIFGKGLLSRLEPISNGPNNAYLGTDGGGGKGNNSSSSDLLVSEALRRSQGALVRAQDSASRPAPVDAAMQRPLLPKHGLGRCDAGVRADLARTALLSGLTFGGGELKFVSAKKLTDLAVFKRPSDGVLRAQAVQVQKRAREREDRFAEIHVQMDNLWPFWEAAMDLSAPRAPRTFELLSAALQFASSVVLQLKNDLQVPRPSDVSPLVLPIIGVPGHASFPSGHATAAYMLSTVCETLRPDDVGVRPLLRRLAYRVAYNREVAGVHYPIDSLAGRVLGCTLGNYFCAAAGANAGLAIPMAFDASALDEEAADALTGDTQDLQLGVGVLAGVTVAKDAKPVQEVEPLAAMWDMATEELKGLAR